MTADALSVGSSASPLSFPSRSVRGARAAAHVVKGIFVPKHLEGPGAVHSSDPLGKWCRDLLSLLGVGISVSGGQRQSLPISFLLVSNHVSWMDICVIRALFPVRFIAKEEISLWPVVGASAREAGTLFLGRQRLSSFRETVVLVQESLERNVPVAVFPEGTTTTGDRLLPFRTGIFEVCRRTGQPVLPLSIRYENSDRTPLTAVSYTGGESFARSFWRTLGEARITARVSVADPVFPEGSDRKQLAGKVWHRVRAGLTSLPDPFPKDGMG